MKKIEKDLRQYYDDRLKDHGFSAMGMGWKNETAQARRFEQVVKVINGNNFSINDLGCGSGDLFAYLSDQPGMQFSYSGYDMLENMIDHARSKYSTSDNATFRSISSANELQPADYTVACGIFNLRYSVPEKEWLEYILQTLEIMDARSKKGMSFNALTSYSDKELMEEQLYYADPLFLFDHCKKKFSRNVALLHDYNEYDFTIIVRK